MHLKCVYYRKLSILGVSFLDEVGIGISCFNAGFTAVDKDVDSFKVVGMAGSFLMSS